MPPSVEGEGKEMAQAPGNSRPRGGAEAGQAQGFGGKEDERAPRVKKEALEKEESLS